MNEENKPAPRRPEVLKNLTREHLKIIEHGLLGDLPERLKPYSGPVRSQSTQLVESKPSGFFTSCLPTVPDSPGSEKSSEDDNKVSPIKKTFSFRDRFSRISFLGKNKDKIDKTKWKTTIEDDSHSDIGDTKIKADREAKVNKRFMMFKNKELAERKKDTPVYRRSKSFELLPKAIEECEEENTERKNSLKNNLAQVYSDSGKATWNASDSFEFLSNVYYDDDDGVFLKSVKEITPDSSNNNSSGSTFSSESSGTNLLKTVSVQQLLNDFNNAVDSFYLSDSEPYVTTNKIEVVETRKSASFSTLPLPKVQTPKVSEISEDFKKHLNTLITNNNIKKKPVHVRISALSDLRTSRRGSVTDWFVLEDKLIVGSPPVSEENKYRRAQKKPKNPVRRMSSTKYWITPEECAEFTREQRPPLIPRIKHRAAVRAPCPHHDYEDSHHHEPIKGSVYEPLEDWSPTSDRSRSEIDRSFSKDSSDSPPVARLLRDVHRRIGGSTENLQNMRRPYYPQLPASSSGDSLDVEVRDHKQGYSRNRKSRSLVAPKPKIKTPIPAPRLHLTPEAKVIDAGAVKRTKFTENGGTKKCRKNWVDCFMVLTPTALVFYKDERTYSAFKASRQSMSPPSPNAPRPELILPLINAHVMQCLQMHTKRYTRSLVLNVQYDQYLIQLDSEEKAKMWLDRIVGVHFNLGPPKPADLHHQSSSTDLDSLGRTPPVARHINKSHKAGGSSNEDLGDPVGSIPKSHVRRILRNFFPKRPTMDSLMKTGIYKDEQVFGRHLADSCAGENPQVPPFVVFCVKQIESSVENMCADGLYRASGNLSQVQKIRLEVDQSNLSMQIENLLETISDIHVLTGSLKLFFRELKEPLIPCSMFDRILAACSIRPKEAKVKEFRDIVNSLPQCNRDTLKFLLEHLLRVTGYSEQNRMHTANLAIVFGPTLLWAPAEQAHNIAIDCIQQNLVVEILLNEFKEIFDESKGKKKS